MDECTLGRQAAFDQPIRRRSLCDVRVATVAGIARANGHDDLRAGRDDVQPSSAILADPYHIKAAAGADILRRFNHLFDARQMVWQMAKIAFGGRASGFAIGVAFCLRISAGLGIGDSRFEILKGQLTRIGVCLLGPVAMMRVAQLGIQVILTLGPGFQPCNLGLHGQKNVTHDGRKNIEINEARAEHGLRGTYWTPQQLSVFTKRSESFCCGKPHKSWGADTAPVKAYEQCFKLHARQAHDAITDLGRGKTVLFQALVDHHDPAAS